VLWPGVCVSVCLCVCHKSVFTYQANKAARQSRDSSFLVPNGLVKFHRGHSSPSRGAKCMWGKKNIAIFDKITRCILKTIRMRFGVGALSYDFYGAIADVDRMTVGRMRTVCGWNFIGSTQLRDCHIVIPQSSCHAHWLTSCLSWSCDNNAAPTWLRCGGRLTVCMWTVFKPASQRVQALADISRSALYAIAVYKAIRLRTCMLS